MTTTRRNQGRPGQVVEQVHGQGQVAGAIAQRDSGSIARGKDCTLRAAAGRSP